MQSKKRKLKTEEIGITALYNRLSRDDGTESESNSIANQKKLLSQKAKELGLTNTRFYVDDGYTGTNFNRPSFQQMIEDIEMGYVTTVMVKTYPVSVVITFPSATTRTVIFQITMYASLP